MAANAKALTSADPESPTKTPGVRATDRLRRVLCDKAPAIRDAVLTASPSNPDELHTTASTDALRNALAVRLDAHLAAMSTPTCATRVIRAPEGWRDVDITVTLTDWDKGPVAGCGSMFEVTMRCEYRIRPASSTMRFACVSDLDDYRELLRGPTVTAPGFVDRSGGVDAGSRPLSCSRSVSMESRRRFVALSGLGHSSTRPAWSEMSSPATVSKRGDYHN